VSSSCCAVEVNKSPLCETIGEPEAVLPIVQPSAYAPDTGDGVRIVVIEAGETIAAPSGPRARWPCMISQAAMSCAELSTPPEPLPNARGSGTARGMPRTTRGPRALGGRAPAG